MTFLTDRFGITSKDNSSENNLGSSATFTGNSENVENYGNINVTVRSDVDGGVAGVQLQFSPDNVNWDVIETYTYVAPNTLIMNTNVKAKYFRVVYINGSSATSIFRLQTIYTQTKTSSADGATDINFNQNSVDAFGRLKVSDPTTLLDLTHTKDKNDLQIHELTFGGATSIYDDNSSSVLMTVSANGDRVIRQSRRYAVYQPGKSLYIIATGIINAGTNGTDTISRMGYYDDDEGIFIEYDGATIYIVKRQNGSDTRVAQSSWSDDKLDGTGNSGITLDTTKAQIIFIDVEWLGVGTVRVGFFVDGSPIIAHKFHHANKETNTYMKTANLPIRYEISANNTGSPSGSLRQICATVISDGGYNPIGRSFGANTGSTTRKGDHGTPLPLISIRLKTPEEIGGTGPAGIIEPRTSVNVKQFSAITTNTGGKGTRADLYLTQDVGDSILTGVDWVGVHPNSSVEYDISATEIDLSNSIPIQSLMFSNQVEIFSSSFESIIGINTNINTIGATGISDILTLVVEPLDSGSNVAYAGTMNWEEIY